MLFHIKLNNEPTKNVLPKTKTFLLRYSYFIIKMVLFFISIDVNEKFDDSIFFLKLSMIPLKKI